MKPPKRIIDRAEQNGTVDRAARILAAAYLLSSEANNLIDEAADCAGFCFSMDDIITDLEEDAPPGKILEWYHRLEELDYRVNYHSWLHGCPTPSKSELEEMHRKAEEARRDLEKEAENWE